MQTLKQQLELQKDTLIAIQVNSEDEDLRAEINNVLLPVFNCLWELETPEEDTELFCEAVIEATKERIKEIINNL